MVHRVVMKRGDGSCLWLMGKAAGMKTTNLWHSDTSKSNPITDLSATGTAKFYRVRITVP